MSATPEPHQIASWQDAEQNAAAWMRHWGFRNARLTGPGSDGGIDVRSSRALAQVKFEARQVGRPALQRLVGARSRDGSETLLFFTGGGYAQTAIDYAAEYDIALFHYDLTGRMTPVNRAAMRFARAERAAERAAEDPVDGVDGASDRDSADGRAGESQGVESPGRRTGQTWDSDLAEVLPPPAPRGQVHEATDPDFDPRRLRKGDQVGHNPGVYFDYPSSIYAVSRALNRIHAGGGGGRRPHHGDFSITIAPDWIASHRGLGSVTAEYRYVRTGGTRVLRVRWSFHSTAAPSEMQEVMDAGERGVIRANEALARILGVTPVRGEDPPKRRAKKKRWRRS